MHTFKYYTNHIDQEIIKRSKPPQFSKNHLNPPLLKSVGDRAPNPPLVDAIARELVCPRVDHVVSHWCKPSLWFFGHEGSYVSGRRLFTDSTRHSAPRSGAIYRRWQHIVLRSLSKVPRQGLPDDVTESLKYLPELMASIHALMPLIISTSLSLS